jgi:hypothetical protein
MKLAKPPKIFKRGQTVVPVAECNEQVVFRVLGSSVFKDQWWTPIDDPREEDPTFFKTALLTEYGNRNWK